MAYRPDEPLTLADQFRLLAQSMPEDEAKARLGRLFRLSGRSIYSPKYSASYEDADIDFATGRVTLPRLPRQRFTPTVTAERHYDLFPENRPEYRREARCRQWVERFRERQRNIREWIAFDQIADWCAKSVTGSSAGAEEQARILAYRRLDQSVRLGEFDALCRGRRQSRILYIHPRRMRHGENRRWLTREQLAHVQDISSLATYCWLRRELARQWLEAHGYPWPPHFAPSSAPSAPPEAKPLRPTATSRSANRRGPTPGSTGFGRADDALCPTIDEMLASGKARSAIDAARILDKDKKITGAGSGESRAIRLARRYGKWKISRR